MSAIAVVPPAGLQNLIALTPEQDEALTLARKFEAQAERMAPFSPGRICLLVVAKELRAYVAATM